jgi:hypothetical protein
MDFWIGIFGLVLGILGLLGLFTKNRRIWFVVLLMCAAVAALGFIWGKLWLEDAAEQRKVNAAKREILALIAKEGGQSFQQLVEVVPYANFEVASKAINDLVDQHQLLGAMVPVKDEEGNSYTVQIYNPPLGIKKLKLLDESRFEGSGETSGSLNELVDRSSTTYVSTNPGDLNITFVALVNGYCVGHHLNTDVELEVDILDSSKRVLASQIAYRTYNVSDWRARPTASRIGPSKVASFLGIPLTDCASSPIVYFITSKGFKPPEMMQGRVFLHLNVIDHLGNAQSAFDQQIEIRKQW